ncbi:MAG: DUF1343 domain-containing protein [Akkermansiaceae bacterium]|nr:DUF1343 domain-containing protein [Akkermansiaceae bacterium]
MEELPRREILREWNAELERFAPRRQKHLLYP